MAVKTEGTLLAGRYRVLGKLGTGGMATVFLCEDERLGRKVAVKRLHAESPADTARRFQREAKLGASLNHQNVVSIFDTVTDEEGVLIVMEYVDGETLAQIMRRQEPLPPQRVTEILGGVADALDHAHERGVVHRDIKPANILVGRDGEAKLVDLGIATALEGTRITRSGTVLGTAAYMAPEQLDGATPGPMADVYSLATVAFELLCGCKARQGRTPVEIAQKIVSEPAPDLRDAWPQAPVAAAGVLRRAMSRDPSERPASARRLIAELESAFAEATGATRAIPGGDGNGSKPAPTPAPVPAAAAPPVRRHTSSRARELRWILPAALAALLALVIGGIIFFGGSDGDEGSSSGEPQRSERSERGDRSERGQQDQPSGGAAPAPAPDEEAPAGDYEVPQPSGDDPARGAQLDREGKALIDQGQYAEAVPVLEEAVRSFPPGADDLNYAYALYNLGNALRLAGRPDDAIPVLEERLKIDNQRGVVQAELERARRDAGG